MVVVRNAHTQVLRLNGLRLSNMVRHNRMTDTKTRTATKITIKAMGRTMVASIKTRAIPGRRRLIAEVAVLRRPEVVEATRHEEAAVGVRHLEGGYQMAPRRGGEAGGMAHIKIQLVSHP